MKAWIKLMMTNASLCFFYDSVFMMVSNVLYLYYFTLLTGTYGDIQLVPIRLSSVH